jgi:transcriptional regulator GlxA family with amidase domain
VPRFSLIALSSVVALLRLANSVLERPTFEFVTLGLSTDPVVSSDDIRVLPDASMSDGLGFDAVFMIGPNPIPRRGLGVIAAWLRRQAA